MNVPVESIAADRYVTRRGEIWGKILLGILRLLSPLPESFEAQGGLEFQELAVV